MAHVVRCRRCSGILKANYFALEEACRCETTKGRKARSAAMNGFEEERPASLRELQADTGLVW